MARRGARVVHTRVQRISVAPIVGANGSCLAEVKRASLIWIVCSRIGGISVSNSSNGRVYAKPTRKVRECVCVSAGVLCNIRCVCVCVFDLKPIYDVFVVCVCVGVDRKIAEFNQRIRIPLKRY